MGRKRPRPGPRSTKSKVPCQGLPLRKDRERRARREDFAHPDREENTIHHEDTIEDMNIASCMARNIARRKLDTLWRGSSEAAAGSETARAFREEPSPVQSKTPGQCERGWPINMLALPTIDAACRELDVDAEWLGQAEP